MFDKFNELVDSYKEELAGYQYKPTKASARRLRNLINELRKTAVQAKKDLIELDAKGY